MIGWNWNIDFESIENITYNFVYQCINILLGNNFLESNVKSKKDIIIELENKLKAVYGEELANSIYLIICKISILEYLKIDNKKIKQMITTKDLLLQEVKNMENKKQYLQNLAESKKLNGKKIREIDTILNDNKLIREKFIEKNNKLSNDNKIFSLSDFVDELQKERNKLIKELDLYNDLMKPENYVKTKAELNNKINLLKNINETNWNIEEDIKTCLLQFNNLVLDGINIKIKKSETKKEIIDLIYVIRYYKLLPIENAQIKDVKELQTKINKTEQQLITKACKLKILSIICSKITENYKIMSKILESKIIDLEKISIELKQLNNKVLLNIYDDNVIDNSIEFENIEELKVKYNKKIKIFI